MDIFVEDKLKEWGLLDQLQEQFVGRKAPVDISCPPRSPKLTWSYKGDSVKYLWKKLRFETIEEKI